MSFRETPSTREGAKMCAFMMQNPDDMILWLKFSNNKVIVNSACTEDFLVQWGEPLRLPDGRGLYRNWGAYFDYGDSIEVLGGLRPDKKTPILK